MYDNLTRTNLEFAHREAEKRIEELKDEIATRNGKLAILISENERLKGIVLGNEEEISDLKKSCDETQELLDKQIEATYKLDKENAELKKENAEAKNLIEELASSLSVVGECDEEECELINKAQKFINKPIF